jgi:hypothetical protein
MKLFKKILLFILIVFIVIQFIQPEKNKAEGIAENDISKVYNMPQELHQTLITKCYDCHSNNTQYPWYANIQPVAWWLASHIKDGRKHLDFSAFKTYSKERAEHKLEELGEVVRDHSMPLKSYVLLHPETELTEDDERAINNWLKSLGAIDE